MGDLFSLAFVHFWVVDGSWDILLQTLQARGKKRKQEDDEDDNEDEDDAKKVPRNQRR